MSIDAFIACRRPSTGSGRTDDTVRAEPVEATTQTLLERLVALNAQRASEEAVGRARCVNEAYMALEFTP